MEFVNVSFLLFECYFFNLGYYNHFLMKIDHTKSSKLNIIKLELDDFFESIWVQNLQVLSVIIFDLFDAKNLTVRMIVNMIPFRHLQLQTVKKTSLLLNQILIHNLRLVFC